MKNLLTISLLAFLGTTMTNLAYSAEDFEKKENKPEVKGKKNKEGKKNKKEEKKHKGGSLKKIVDKLGLDMNPHVGNLKSLLAKEKRMRKR